MLAWEFVYGLRDNNVQGPTLPGTFQINWDTVASYTLIKISDYDTPFLIINIKKNVTNHALNTLEKKKVDMNQYANDFSKLPLSLVCWLEELEDQISTLNKLFTDCLESHAPTRQVKLTRIIHPWIKDPTIVSDRQKLELSQIKSRDNKNPKEY